MLGGTSGPLLREHDVLLLDLDGVVYVGTEAVPGAAEGLAAFREFGGSVAYVTNNASRPAAEVAGHLTELGIRCQPRDVVTSAQAAARIAVREWGVGARVWPLGGPGVADALMAVGLQPTPGGQGCVGVVSGFGPDLVWREIALAGARIRNGLPWIASNIDAQFPSPGGPAPGHGALVRLLADFSGVEPMVAGKPARPLMQESIDRTSARSPLMIGDVLATDIAGAHNIGIQSALVRTGITTFEVAAHADPEERPHYIIGDLTCLQEPMPEPVRANQSWNVHGWQATVTHGTLHVVGGGSVDDWWRAGLAACWDYADTCGRAADLSHAQPPG